MTVFKPRIHHLLALLRRKHAHSKYDRGKDCCDNNKRNKDDSRLKTGKGVVVRLRAAHDDWVFVAAF
jgi:hypothetical protein